MACRAAYPIRARNMPYDSIHEHLGALSDAPTKKELDTIWENKGTRCAYRSALGGMDDTVRRVLAQLSGVYEVDDISVFSSIGHLMSILQPHGKALLFSTYQILLGVETRRGAHLVYIYSGWWVAHPPHPPSPLKLELLTVTNTPWGNRGIY